MSIIDVAIRLAGREFSVPVLHLFYDGFLFLYGPLLYLYTKGVVYRDFSFKTKHLFHFVPYALFLMYFTIAVLSLDQHFGEEFIYRAFLINRFLELGVDSKMSRIISVVLSSVIFGLVHYQWGPIGMVQTGFMGLALGICYLKFGKKLWIMIFAHAYMDTILMVQLYLA